MGYSVLALVRDVKMHGGTVSICGTESVGQSRVDRGADKSKESLRHIGGKMEDYGKRIPEVHRA